VSKVINQREYKKAIQKADKKFIKKALKKFDNNITLTAHCLGINRATIYRKLAKYKMQVLTKRK
jgi:transcriptional regulator with PAS, ATPase and Fis domain